MKNGSRPHFYLTLLLLTVTLVGVQCRHHKILCQSAFRLTVNWQKRIVEKIREVAADPYARHNNVSKLQGRDGYRLRIGDWRVIYQLHDDRLELWALEVGPRGGIY
jgi:mRNA interferase RelE/StbE